MYEQDFKIWLIKLKKEDNLVMQRRLLEIE